MTTGNHDNYFTGKLLLAMPQLGDPRFHKAVIFICAHDENGAMGLVVNHVLPGLEMKQLLNLLKIPSDIELDVDALKAPILCGGPVEASRGFLLHSRDFSQLDTVALSDDFAVTGTMQALRDALSGEGPKDMLFILGYAGWSAGQLEKEIQENSWLVADPDPAIIFSATPEEKWTRAIGKLGFDPAMLSSAAGRA